MIGNVTQTDSSVFAEVLFIIGAVEMLSGLMKWGVCFHEFL